MKRSFQILTISVVIVIFSFVVYNSKRDYYAADKDFYYNAYFNSEVAKIVDGRGTKIYYNDSDFFYTDALKDNLEVEQLIEIGDIVKKQDSVLEIFRRDKNGDIQKIFTGKIEKPESSYFSYFFN